MRQRKSTQQELDSNLTQANSIAKQIGLLMKEGKREEAEGIKKETAILKEAASVLKDKVKETRR